MYSMLNGWIMFYPFAFKFKEILKIKSKMFQFKPKKYSCSHCEELLLKKKKELVWTVRV